MENRNLKNIFPLGFILPFALIIIFELIILYGLDFYKEKLTQDISDLELSLKQKEENLSLDLRKNESFYVFSQVANIVEILNHRKSLSSIISKFNKIMPNFLIIENVEIDVENNLIKLNGAINNWDEYVKLYRYLLTLNDIEIREFNKPIFDEEKNLIKIYMVIFLKSSFYQ